MTIKYYITLFIFFCTQTVWAQDGRFTASVSKSQVAAGEQFEVSFTLNSNGDRFTPPDFNGFEVVSGPNESSSMTSVNGAVSQSVSVSYVLMATREGSYTIGPASIIINGKQVSTSPVRITVKGHAVQRSSGQGQGQGGADAVTEAPTGDLSKDIFMRAVVDKTNVYLGQQITLSYKLYTRIPIVANDLDKSPDLNGFWSQDIKNNSQNIPWKIEMYKGSRYNVAEIKQTILFPEHSGNLSVDPLAMTFVVRQQMPARDVMEQFFGGNYKDAKIKVASPQVIIHVKPLPEDGKPSGFTGAVGNFSITALVDKKELKANEALNYKLKITGSGNIKLLKDVNINTPADFEKYDPKITDSVTEAESGVSGSRVLNYLIIPRHEGNYTIEPVKFSYFNPANNRYVTLTSKAFNIKVNKGADGGGNVTSLAPADQRAVKMLSKDIRYIKTSRPGLYRDGETFYGSAGYWLLLLVGPLALLSALFYRRWNEKNNSDVVKVKSRMAGKIAAKHMANAHNQLEAGNTKAFYEAISRGMYGYLSDKLNIPAANLNRENITSVLKARLLDDALITKLTDTLDLCEMARFAPVFGVSQQDVFTRAKSIIDDIETKI